MVKSVIFPSLPSILQDMWVYLELFISIIAFVFGLMDIFPIEDGLAFNYTYFAFAAIAMALALIDAFIYFVQLGSCARLVRHCFIAQAVNRERLSDEVKVDENVISQHKFYQLSKKTKKMFTTWFELCRSILSEL